MDEDANEWGDDDGVWAVEDDESVNEAYVLSDDRNLWLELYSGRVRQVVPVVIVAGVFVVVVIITQWDGATLVESVIVGVLAELCIGVIWAVMWYPLGADLHASRPLKVSLFAAGAVTVVWWVLFSSTFSQGPSPVSSEFGVLVTVFTFLAGLVSIGYGLGSVPTYRRLAFHAGPEPADARPGPVAVGGRVGTADDSAENVESRVVEAPLTGEPAVCVHTEVVDPKTFEETNVKHEIVVNDDGVPFVLRDGDASVEVRPRDAELRLDTDFFRTVGSQPLPERFADFLVTHHATPWDDFEERRFTESRLEHGDPATVIGDARGRDGRLVVDAATVLDGPIEAVLSDYRSAVVRGIAGGLLLVAASNSVMLGVI